MSQRVAIVGAGAVGSLLAGILSHGGMDVTLIERREKLVETLTRDGLRVIGARGAYEVRPRVVTDAADAGEVDLVIVCVKAYDTAAAVAEHRALFRENTTALSLQNGIGNVEAIGEVVDPNRILAGTTTMGATLLEPGLVRHAGEGETAIGSVSGGASPLAEEWAATLTAAGLPVKAVADVPRLLWTKLCVNVGINPFTALLAVENGRLARLPFLADSIETAVRETVAVAAAEGVRLDAGEMLGKVWEVVDRTHENKGSMCVDLEAGRRTEIEAINGAVARLAKLHGIATPANDLLVGLILGRETTRSPR